MGAVLAFAIGASLGSFLNVVIDRLPLGKSLVRPRSSCDACHTELAPRDLVPIFSYLFLRGRCRHCGARIPLRVLFIEVATASLLTGLYLQHGFSPELAVLAAAMAFALVVAGIDWNHQLILNVLTLPAAVVALALAPLWPELEFQRTLFGHGGNLASFLNALAAGTGASLGFVGIVALTRGGMGWGDAKLGLVLGLLLGYPAIVVSLWLSVVCGGLVAAMLWATRRKGGKDPLPFGVFLAGGAIATLFLLAWITSRYQEMGLQAFTW